MSAETQRLQEEIATAEELRRVQFIADGLNELYGQSKGMDPGKGTDQKRVRADEHNTLRTVPVRDVPGIRPQVQAETNNHRGRAKNGRPAVR